MERDQIVFKETQSDFTTATGNRRWATDQHVMGKAPVRDQLTAQETDWYGPQLLQYCWKDTGHSKCKEQLGAVIPRHW